MVTRTGLTTIKNLMIQVCRLIGKWQGTIRKVYPDNTALHLALDAALAACAALEAEADAVLPDGV